MHTYDIPYNIPILFFLVNSVLRLLAAENTQQRRNTFIQKCSQMISFGSFSHSHSLGMMNESHPLFSLVIPQDVVDAVSSCGFKIIWINSWLTISSRLIEQKRIPLMAWEVPKLAIAGGWGHSTREIVLAVFPGQTLLIAF